MAENDTIIQHAEKLGQLVAEHPSIKKYADAHKALTADPDASKLFKQFDDELMKLAQQEQMGQPVTSSQQANLQKLQSQLAANLKVKAFSMAQVEMTDFLRKVSQAWQKPVAAAQGVSKQGGAAGGSSPFASGGGLRM